MIEINLLPVEFRRKETAQFKLPDLPYLRIGGIFFAVLLALEAILFGALLWMKAGLGGVEKEIKKLGPDFERVKGIKLEKFRSDSKLRALDGLMNRPFSWAVLLNAVSDSLPDGLWLTEAGVERKTIEIDAPKAPAPAKASSSKRARRVAAPKKIKKHEYYLVIRGSAPISSRTTAAVGKYIQELERQPVVTAIAENVKLEKIDRVTDKEERIHYVFTIRSLIKRGYMGAENAD